MKRFLKSAVLAAAILAAGCGVYAYATRPEPELMTYVFTVQPGDTIWSICAKAATDLDNMRELMDRTKLENGITDAGNLQPGREIVVRVRALE